MAIKKNNAIQSNHFRKDWQRRVRVHLDQAGKKHSRRVARASKAKLVAPAPLEALRPIVRAPTLKYNRKVRAGRGFSLEEIKAAGLNKGYARTIGIAVDHRRQNRSVEGLELNVARLKEYLSKLVVFKATKKGEKSPASSAVQVSTAEVFPIPSISKEIEVKAVDASAPSAFKTLREARSVARYQGIREKRARDKAEAEAEKKK